MEMVCIGPYILQSEFQTLKQMMSGARHGSTMPSVYSPLSTRNRAQMQVTLSPKP